MAKIKSNITYVSYLTHILRENTTVGKEDKSGMSIGLVFIDKKGKPKSEILEYQKDRYHFGQAQLDNTFLPIKDIINVEPKLKFLNKIKYGHIIYDDADPYEAYPYLVVKKKKQKCLLGFIAGGNDEPPEWGFDDGEYIIFNSKLKVEQAINPINKKLINLIKPPEDEQFSQPHDTHLKKSK